MTRYFDTTLNYFVTEPGSRERVIAAEFYARDNTDEVVIFCDGSTRKELAAGTTGKFILKPPGEFGGSALALADSWTKAGTGTGATYTFALDLNTAAVVAELGNAADKVAVIAEMTWTAGGKIYTSRYPTALLYNDAARGSEGTPIVVAGTSFTLQSPNGTVWTITITNQGNLVRTPAA